MTSNTQEPSTSSPTSAQVSSTVEEPRSHSPSGSMPLSEQRGSIRWEIKHFSRQSDKIYSETFSTGSGSDAHEWRVIVYPRGNKSEDLSLYLDSVKSTLLPPRVAKKAHFTLSIINQLDIKKSFLHSFTNIFNKVDQSWGWTTGTVNLADIIDEGKGFKRNDTVIVECHVQVVVLDEPPLLKDDEDIFLYEQEGSIRFPIKAFSRFEDKKILFSESFMSGDHKWKLSVYPKGNDSEDLSLYLEASEPPKLPCNTTRKALFVLAIENQTDLKRSFRQSTYLVFLELILPAFSQYFTKSQSSWGLTTGTVKLAATNDEKFGWKKDDTVVVAGHVQMATRACDYSSRRETGHIGIKRECNDKTHLNIHDFNCSRVTDRLVGLLQDLFYCAPIRQAVFDTPSEPGSFVSELQAVFFGLQFSDTPVSADTVAACLLSLPKAPPPAAGLMEWASILWGQLENVWIGRPQFASALQCLGHVGAVEATDFDAFERGSIRVTLQDNGCFVDMLRAAIARARRKERTMRARGRKNKTHTAPLHHRLLLPSVVHVFISPSPDNGMLGRCEFPEYLDADDLARKRKRRKTVDSDSEWESDSDSRPGHDYVLQSVIVNTSDKGCRHFVRDEDRWYRFEAGTVVRVSKHDAINANYGGNGFSYTLAGSPYTCKPRLPASVLVYVRAAHASIIMQKPDPADIPSPLQDNLFDTSLTRVSIATAASLKVMNGFEVIDFSDAITFVVPRNMTVAQFRVIPAMRADIASRRLHFWACKSTVDGEAAPSYCLASDDDELPIEVLMRGSVKGLFLDIEPCATCLKNGVNDPVLGKFTAKDRSALSVYRKSVKLDRMRLGQSAVQYPLLHLAAAEADARCVLQMMRSGMDPLLRHYAYHGCTPLHMAAEHGRRQIVSAMCELVTLHPVVEPPSRGHQSLLPPSSKDEPKEATTRAAIDAVDIDGLTPLHYAVRVGHLGCVEALLDHNAPLDCRDRNGNTPLHHAVIQDDEAIAMALVSRGANRNAENAEERTPLDIASKDLRQALKTASAKTDGNKVVVAIDHSADDDTLVALLADDVAGTNGQPVKTSKKKSRKKKKKGKNTDQPDAPAETSPVLPQSQPRTTPVPEEQKENERLNNLAEELMSLRKQIADLNELIPSLESENEQLKADVTRLRDEGDLSHLRSENDDLRREKGLAELATEQLRAEIEHLRHEMGLGSLDAVVAAEHTRLVQDNDKLSASLRQAVAQLHSLKAENERLMSTAEGGWQVQGRSGRR